MRAIKLVNDRVSIHHHLANEIAVIRSLMLEDWQCTIVHTLKEGNHCADFMAKMGTDSDDRLHGYSSATKGTEPVALCGCEWGVFHPRLVFLF